MGDKRATLIPLLFLFSALGVVFPMPVDDEVIFNTETEFSIPEYNSAISFATGGSYSNASLIDNIWYFSGLILEGATNSIPAPFFSGIRFSVSAQNCKVSITQLDTLNVYPPNSGRIAYSVSGVGNQTLNLNYSYENWLSYSVYIDGKEKLHNEGWTATKEGWITVNDATSEVKIQYKRASETFTPSNIFNIPEYNSSINFASNGAYVYTNFKNNIWKFQNLIVNPDKTRNVPVWYLSMTAKDCKVIITNYTAPVVNGRDAWIKYTVTAMGSQTIDNNNNRLGRWEITNYTVFIDGTKRPQNEGWTTADDGWLTIRGATSNVTIFYEYIQVGPEPERGGGPTEGIDKYFLTRVSILILITAVIMTILVIILFVSKKFKKSAKNMSSNSS